MTRLKIPGLTYGVVRDGRLVRVGALGMSDLEHAVRTRKEALFEVGSITKQFTAVATMQLVEAGKVSLDDSVNKYLPDAAKVWEPITLRHLLYQTSGLPDYALVPGLGLTDDFTRETFMKKMGEFPLDFAPGDAWAYSNTNYALLGFVIEKASGQTYLEYMQEHVLKAAGMNQTRFSNLYEIVPRRAHGYLLNEGTVLRTLPSGGSINSDGTLMSNVADMAKWDQTLRSGKLLKKSSYDLLWKPAVLNSGRTRPYGMGFFLNAPKFPAFVGHHGNSAGYGAGHAHYPEKKLSVIVMANIYPAPGNVLAAGIAEQLEPSLRFVPPKPTADPSPERTERIKQAFTKLAANAPDAELLEPEFIAPLSTGRARNFPSPYAPFRTLKRFDFVGAEPVGSDTLVTYRAETDTRGFTGYFTYTPSGKVANIVLKTDPASVTAPKAR